MKIQPVDFNLPSEPPSAPKPLLKSRFKRLFERQFSSVLRIPPPQKLTGGKEGTEEFEPSSACLAIMVQNFIEESNNEKPQQRCDARRCHRCNGNCTDAPDKESETSDPSSSDACDLLRSLVPCLCDSERNVLADSARILDRNKMNKRKDDQCRKDLTDGLISLGYNASICTSKWEKSPSFPAGEYAYVDVVTESERYIIDTDFRSEFEVARATKAYRAVLQTLPSIFVGQSDRLERVVSIVCEATRQSLKKEGMPFPPWRKAEYVKAKWLSPFTRISNSSPIPKSMNPKGKATFVWLGSDREGKGGGIEEGVKEWKPVENRGKGMRRGVKVVTGLASLIQD